MVRWAVAICFVFLAGTSQAKEIGKFAYLKSIDSLDGDTIRVCDTMAALSNKVLAKINVRDSTILKADTPSIFFVIDNSSSMSYADSINDSAGNRFTATRSFIEMLYKETPNAEVGVSVFASYLYFDPNDNALFKKCQAQTNGAYIPLLVLNKTYAEYGNKTGLTLLQELLDTTRYQASGINYTNLKYRPTNMALRTTGTNINAGFDAAKDAFLNSAINRDKKEKHFIIFLSDGEANMPQNGTARQFMQALNCPPTFTIYFTRTGKVPDTIDTFTTNAKVNNYSTRDSLSAYWAYLNTSSNSLLAFLMKNIMSQFTVPIPVKPAQMTLGTQTSTSWDKRDSMFIFNNIFPLNKGSAITPFTAIIRYNSFVKADTTRTIKFFVERRRNYDVSPLSLYDMNKWDRTLALRDKNGQVLSAIPDTTREVELYFTFNQGTAQYNYSNAKVEVGNAVGARDAETYTLNAGTNVFYLKRGIHLNTPNCIFRE